MKPPRKSHSAAGTSIVEVMLAVTILSILAIAGTSFFYHSRSGIERIRNRRVAMESAVSRLEALRQAAFTTIAPTNETYTLQYLQRTNNTWLASETDPGETVLVNGRSMPITTTIQYLDLEEDENASYDYLQARVEVGYRVGGDERVALESRISP